MSQDGVEQKAYGCDIETSFVERATPIFDAVKTMPFIMWDSTSTDKAARCTWDSAIDLQAVKEMQLQFSEEKQLLVDVFKLESRSIREKSYRGAKVLAASTDPSKHTHVCVVLRREGEADVVVDGNHRLLALSMHRTSDTGTLLSLLDKDGYIPTLVVTLTNAGYLKASHVVMAVLQTMKRR